jgi:hypothetical protein
MWLSIAMSPKFQAFLYAPILEQRRDKNSELSITDTISSHIMSSSYDFGTSRHTAYNTVFCRGVQIDVVLQISNFKHKGKGRLLN